MIRAEVITDFHEIDAWDSFLDAYPQLANEAVIDGFNQHIREPMLAELRHTPGPVRYPLQWSSERQRKAFFASDGFGRGVGAPRTGETVGGWKAEVQLFEGSAVMSVSNRSKALRFVTGDRQQPFHANTGWQRHRPTIDFWRNAAAEDAVQSVRNLLGQRK